MKPGVSGRGSLRIELVARTLVFLSLTEFSASIRIKTEAANNKNTGKGHVIQARTCNALILSLARLDEVVVLTLSGTQVAYHNCTWASE
jgi:hypothetical protein